MDDWRYFPSVIIKKMFLIQTYQPSVNFKMYKIYKMSRKHVGIYIHSDITKKYVHVIRSIPKLENEDSFI